MYSTSPSDIELDSTDLGVVPVNVFDLFNFFYFSVKVEDEWQVRYIRQCASGGEIGAYDGRVCKDRIGTSGVKMTYCHCSTEGCNSASAWNVPVLLMVGAFTGQYIWRKL